MKKRSNKFLGMSKSDAYFGTLTQLHEKTQLILTRERRHERVMQNNNNISSIVSDFISFVCSLNIHDKLNQEPKSMQEYENRKQAIKRMYVFAEYSYTKAYISAFLFDYCDKCLKNDKISVEQKEMLLKQKILAEKYRELYRKLLDYVNFLHENIVTLYVMYTYKELWIWEVESYYANEPKFDVDILAHLRKRIMLASQDEDKYINEMNQLVSSLRTALVEYLKSVDIFEQKMLTGELSEYICTENHLKKFDEKRSKYF